VTSNNKQVTLLTNPLNKIQAATEATTAILMQISEVILGGANGRTGAETGDELKKQTTILSDIRSILREQNRTLEKGVGSKGGPGGGMFTPMSAKDVGLTALMIVGVAGAIVGAAALFTLVPKITLRQLFTVLAVAGIFALIAPTFVKIAEVLGRNSRDIIGTNGSSADMSNPKSMFALAGATTLAMASIAISLVLSGAIFTLMPMVNPVQLLLALAVAVIMVPAAFAYSLILKATKDLKKEQLIFAAVAIPLMALGIVGAAYAFMLLPGDGDLKAPDPLWVLKSAFAIGLYAVGFYFIMKAIKGIKDPKKLMYGAIAIPLMALSILGVALIFRIFPAVDPNMAPDPLWVLKSAFAIGLYAVGFYFIMKAIRGIKDPKELLYGAIAIPILAIGILGTALIFQGLGVISDYLAPDPLWVLKAGFSLLIFAIPFYIVSKAIKGMSVKELFFMAIALPIVAFGVLAAAWIFQALPDVYKAPEADWTLKAGLAMVIFGAALYLSGKILSSMSIGDLFKALIGVVVTAFAIIAVGWILSYGPSSWISPHLEWSINVAAALGVIGGAIVIMGLAVAALTPATLLLGALGIIVAAITILAVGWILSGLAPVMPSLVTVAQGFTSMLLAPMNGMIDVFARFKNEIGVGNMIGLAVGIAALGGAFLVFTAAMAGSSIAGGIGNIIGGILDGIGKLFGGDQPSPIEMIERLAVIAPSINKLAAPLLNLGRGFSMINAGAIMSIKGFQALSEMHDDIDVDDFKSQATSLRSIAGSYTGIANASKAMNIKAIMATTDMFKSLTDLAKNKGESAMSILAEKLMEAVKQLTGTITNLEKVADKQSENAAKAGDGIQKSLTVVNDSIAGVKKSADKLGAANKEGKLDLKPLIDAIQELESRFDRAIKVKFEGGSGSFLDM
jgi:hypothetical protein